MTDGAILRVTIFAIAMSTASVFEIVELIGSWAWCVVRHFCFFYNVDSFGMDGVLLWHFCVDLVLVLNRCMLTCPTPGFLAR